MKVLLSSFHLNGHAPARVLPTDSKIKTNLYSIIIILPNLAGANLLVSMGEQYHMTVLLGGFESNNQDITEFT